jgi:sporulation protein YqfC
MEEELVKKNFKRNIKRSVVNMLELPKEVMLNLPLITLIGNEEITIENYKGVMEYSSELIRISTSCGVIKIAGKKLSINQITSESLLISGRILEFKYIT